MAVKVGDEWYVDGRKGPFQIEARNGWELEAQIKPGYIIMREADYLKGRYLRTVLKILLVNDWKAI